MASIEVNFYGAARSAAGVLTGNLTMPPEEAAQISSSRGG